MRDEVVLADEAEGGLVGVVETLTADLAVRLGDLLNRPLVVGGPVPGLAARELAEGLLCGFESGPAQPPQDPLGDHQPSRSVWTS